jgi:hypothetical protein
MDNCLVLLPAELVADTVKVNVPAVMGVPVIAPLLKRSKPVGNVPLSRLHIMGVSPVAASGWLYAVPTVPFGNVAVVIVGAVTPPTAVAIVIDNCFVPLPTELVALTVNVYVVAVAGVPVIVPLPRRFKPAGNAPLSRLHIMGVSPVAASGWLYAVPTVPFGNVAVVIVGAVPFLPPPVSLPSPQAPKENPITAIKATIKRGTFAPWAWLRFPNRLIAFFIKHSFYGVI